MCIYFDKKKIVDCHSFVMAVRVARLDGLARQLACGRRARARSLARVSEHLPNQNGLKSLLLPPLLLLLLPIVGRRPACSKSHAIRTESAQVRAHR